MIMDGEGSSSGPLSSDIARGAREDRAQAVEPGDSCTSVPFACLGILRALANASAASFACLSASIEDISAASEPGGALAKSASSETSLVAMAISKPGLLPLPQLLLALTSRATLEAAEDPAVLSAGDSGDQDVARPQQARGVIWEPADVLPRPRPTAALEPQDEAAKLRADARAEALADAPDATASASAAAASAEAPPEGVKDILGIDGGTACDTAMSLPPAVAACSGSGDMLLERACGALRRLCRGVPGEEHTPWRPRGDVPAPLPDTPTLGTEVDPALGGADHGSEACRSGGRGVSDLGVTILPGAPSDGGRSSCDRRPAALKHRFHTVFLGLQSSISCPPGRLGGDGDGPTPLGLRGERPGGGVRLPRRP